MKNYIIVLLCILISTATVNGQSKKELADQVSQLQTELDSTKANYSSLSAVHDSTTKVLDSYIGMYKTIQEKVLPYDFKPEDIGGIIDSLQTSRDSSFTSIMAGSESLRDTISIMSAGIDSLQAEVESQNAEIEKLKAEIEKYKDPTAGISDEQVAALEKIKKLLDSGILTQEEFDSRKKQILGNE
jgi:chromosome segregation ATPase